MRTARQLSGARLVAVTAQRPARSVPNDLLPPTVGADDAWIQARTGIRARGVAGPGESVVELAAAAAAKAVAAAGIGPDDVDLLLLASCSQPSQVPGGAPSVASRIGASGGALDVNAACAGFGYALALAADSVRAGTARYVVVVGAERMSDWLDWSDRGTAILFGDGAGAAVVGAAPPEEDGIGPVVWGSDATGATLIQVPDHGRRLEMDGPAVFRWATAKVVEVAREACARAGVRPAELAGFIPHQANMRIVHGAARALGLPAAAVVADDGVESGNTSAASIPLAFGRLLEQGRLSRGAPVLLVGFGAGLSWAGQVVRCP
ncbi:MAG: beta-ketoacyl-ACP synthase 3 [Mycobacteriales bacterium]